VREGLQAGHAHTERACAAEYLQSDAAEADESEHPAEEATGLQRAVALVEVRVGGWLGAQLHRAHQLRRLRMKDQLAIQEKAGRDDRLEVLDGPSKERERE
jgi:hypothetical protein